MNEGWRRALAQLQWSDRAVGPYDMRGALRMGTLMLVVVGLAISIANGLGWLLLDVYQGKGQDTVAVLVNTIISPGVCVVVGLWVWHRKHVNPRVPFVVALGGTVLTVGSSAMAMDGSAGGHIFTLLVVVYGAYQLPPFAAAVLTVASVLLETAGMMFISGPAEGGVVGIHYGLALVIVAVLVGVSRAGHRTAHARLRRLASHDALTGVHTRQWLDTAFPDTIAAHADGEGTALAVVDVDLFKQVNDVHGHPAGDAVLVAVARRLEEGAGDDDVVVRLGGDELAVLMPGCGEAEARLRADRLAQRVGGTPIVLPDGTPLTVRVSAGVAHAPTDADTAHGLYVAADAALYRAKRRARAMRPGVGGTA